jgi:glycine/D-amino acid oxidase-like deaminating enzyme
VTIVEEKEALGLEATNGNAGIIAPGHSFAWGSPRAPKMLLRSLRGGETAIRMRLTADPRLYTCGLAFLRESTAERAPRNTLVKLRVRWDLNEKFYVLLAYARLWQLVTSQDGTTRTGFQSGNDFNISLGFAEELQ